MFSQYVQCPQYRVAVIDASITMGISDRNSIIFRFIIVHTGQPCSPDNFHTWLRPIWCTVVHPPCSLWWWSTRVLCGPERHSWVSITGSGRYNIQLSQLCESGRDTGPCGGYNSQAHHQSGPATRLENITISWSQQLLWQLFLLLWCDSDLW